MSDETERRLRRLFAETRVDDADDGAAFVARVTGQIAKRRRTRAAGRLAAGLALVTLVISVSPFIVSAATYVALLPMLLTGPFQAVLIPPLGWIASLIVGIAALRRAMASA